ncbi:MAG: SAP domain-containing protein [Methanomassiliicoccaceae archaeon]|nr:SAP domain-containing protein [Methanomassiliicoccaceae archaeon]
MAERPVLNADIDGKTFRSFYYLKEELVCFCEQEGLQTSGGKPELNERISHYLDTGERLRSGTRKRTPVSYKSITEDTLIENDIICSERHRSFFVSMIGKRFTFNVEFQKWLRSNAGKNYGDAVNAYHRILDEKKEKRTDIGEQFEYNTYIRDFFDDNEGKTLADAIKCWKFKKGSQGHNRYEKDDLVALKN